jgi:hypothetical protein
MRIFPPLLLAVLLGVCPGDARTTEEAYLLDGRRAPGTIALDKDGKLRFTPADQADGLSARQFSFVRFPEATISPLQVFGARRITLSDGETLTGPLLEIGPDSLQIRTAWAKRLIVPRAMVASATQLPGWQPIFDDDFATPRKAWRSKLRPAVQHEELQNVAILRDPGQELVYVPTESIAEGRLGVNFEERGETQGLRWVLELTFHQQSATRILTVQLAGSGQGYPVEFPHGEGTHNKVARSPGWHRLTVQFTTDSMRVLLDDTALWYNLERGPGGKLQQVRLTCHADDPAVKTTGSLAVTQFSLARAIAPLVRPPGDPKRDEVWLATGDQLFGDILQANSRTITLVDRRGRRSIPWTDLQGCFLAQPAKMPVQQGERVRLQLRNGLTPDFDLIDGVLLGLDQRHLRLRHACLGDLDLDRASVHEIRPLTP